MDPNTLAFLYALVAGLAGGVIYVLVPETPPIVGTTEYGKHLIIAVIAGGLAYLAIVQLDPGEVLRTVAFGAEFAAGYMGYDFIKLFLRTNPPPTPQLVYPQ
jgi:hypothetical protein